MLKINKIKMLMVLLSCFCFSNLHADYTDEDPYFPRTTAMTFIKQAALIGGAARACGADISVFVNRVNQALYKSSLSSGDKVLASAHFQRALVAAQTAQVYTPAVSCSQVLEDFQNLPLMRDDFQETVLPQLNPTLGQDPEHPAPGPPYPSPVTSTVGDNPPPNIIYLAPAGLPPPPPTPVDSNARNILYTAPSVGTFTDTTKPMPNINELAPNPFTQEEPPTYISNPYSEP